MYVWWALRMCRYCVTDGLYDLQAYRMYCLNYARFMVEEGGVTVRDVPMDT